MEEVLFFVLYVDSEGQTQLIYLLSHLSDHELSLFFLIKVFFKVYVYFVCMHMGLPRLCLVPTEGRRAHQILRNWSYRWL